LPPIVALIAGCAWLSYQAAERSSLADSANALRERIAVAKRTAGEDAPRSLAEQRTRGTKTTVGGKKTSAELREWQQFGEMQLDNGEDSVENLRLNLRMQSRLKKMTAAEILATYDELADSDISREGLAKIETMFFDAAADKDPEMTLRHFESTLAKGDFPMADRLGNTFKKWVGKDTATAIAWLDEMTAAGKFETKRLDGINQTLVRCAGPVIASLLGSDPADSLARLQALPESQRGVVMLWNFDALKPGTELAFAALVRQGLPEAQRASGFNQVASRMAAEGGFAKVSTFLDTIGATPEERQQTAVKVATEGLGRLLKKGGQIDEVHDWMVQQSPQTADRDMGRALISNLNSLGNEKTLAAVNELYAKTGSDQLLEGFLSSRPTRPLGDDAMVLANQIKDPELRQRMQRSILSETTIQPTGGATP
jgi:hypothetical protein